LNAGQVFRFGEIFTDIKQATKVLVRRRAGTDRSEFDVAISSSSFRAGARMTHRKSRQLVTLPKKHCVAKPLRGDGLYFSRQIQTLKNLIGKSSTLGQNFRTNLRCCLRMACPGRESF